MMDKLGELLQDLSQMPAAEAQELLESYAYVAAFAVGQRVRVDGDASITFVVTGLTWRGAAPQYALSWFNSGESKEAWFEEWRLSAAEAAPASGFAVRTPEPSAPEPPQIMGFVGGARA